jgi:hypothetical protein
MSSIKRLALTLLIVVIGLGGLAGVANASENHDNNNNDNGVSSVQHRNVHGHGHKTTEVDDPKGDEADPTAAVGGLLDTVTKLLGTVTDLVGGLL